MGIIHMTTCDGSPEDTGRRWIINGRTYGLFRWKHSLFHVLQRTSLDAVINKRARWQGGSKIRNAWCPVWNEHIYDELAKEGIVIR